MDPHGRGEENPWSQHKIQPPDVRLCPICHGMKLLAYDVPPGHPNFSKTIRCPKCNPQPEEVAR